MQLMLVHCLQKIFHPFKTCCSHLPPMHHGISSEEYGYIPTRISIYDMLTFFVILIDPSMTSHIGLISLFPSEDKL